MTPQELENLRLSARIAALEAIVAGLIKNGTHSAGARQEAARSVDRWLAVAPEAKFSGLSPEDADLFAAEFQNAKENLASFFNNYLGS